ncbi:MAG: sigma-70 family RNA polymerase sigma factor [Thermoleophilia bacterium]|nr:sigma-70 family RNA polymerase sigma factor [Thermoleophilia bacterium]
MKFRPEDDAKLATLSDEDLIRHLVAARDAGDRGQFKLAQNILLDRRYPQVKAMVLAKVPEDDAEDVAMNVMVSAIAKFSFAGSSIGEFVSALKTITKYRIADYHKKKEKAIDVDPLPGGGGEDDAYGPEPTGYSGVDDVPINEIRRAALDELSPLKRRVVVLRLAGYPSKEAAEIVNQTCGPETPMTYVYVDKIFSLYNKRLKELFEEGEDI